MNFERSTVKTVYEKIGIGIKTPVEIVESWNRKIWSPAPYSFEDGIMVIPKDWDQIKGKWGSHNI